MDHLYCTSNARLFLFGQAPIIMKMNQSQQLTVFQCRHNKEHLRDVMLINDNYTHLHKFIVQYGCMDEKKNKFITFTMQKFVILVWKEEEDKVN